MKSNILTPARLAAIIKRVPERTFRITRLAPELLTGGKVDIIKCMEKQGEITAAVNEVKSYVSATHNAFYALDGIGKKSRYHPYGDDDDGDPDDDPDDFPEDE